MAPYTGVTVCRSDGVHQYKVNNTMVINGPKVEAQPDAKGRVYKTLAPNDPKNVEWRKKLGTKMMASFGEADKKEKEYILNAFPEGYLLWDHSLPEGESGAQKTGSRTDAYLYGHPAGRTKRFRSPQEFLPHLRWLAMGDENPCECKVCLSTQKDAAIDRISPIEVTAPKPTPKPVAMPEATSATAPTTASTVIHSQTRTTPTAEQLLDSDPNVAYIYRPGELVWFNKGAAWGLAVICKRQMVASVPHYLLQPLSHPLRHCSSLTKSQDALRPWLAWSVPDTTHRDIGNLKFDEVPWERLLNGEFGSGDAEVDGSILAGKAINDSYTLFGHLGFSTANQSDVFYNGMFLGAEKIWVGEPVRLQLPSNDIVVMVIRHIIESNTSAPMASLHATVIGDIYKFVQIPMPPPYKDQKDWPTPKLPPRMAADVRFRNENSVDANRNIWSEWQLLESRAQRALSVIKGRWYETRTMLPILRAADYQEELLRGITYDAGIWMNARYDTTKQALLRKQNRINAFGRAVPKNLQISLGLDESLGDDMSRDDRSNNQSGQYGSTGAVADGDEQHFMDIDPTGDQHDFFGSS